MKIHLFTDWGNYKYSCLGIVLRNWISSYSTKNSMKDVFVKEFSQKIPTNSLNFAASIHMPCNLLTQGIRVIMNNVSNALNCYVIIIFKCGDFVSVQPPWYDHEVDEGFMNHPYRAIPSAKRKPQAFPGSWLVWGCLSRMETHPTIYSSSDLGSIHALISLFA